MKYVWIKTQFEGFHRYKDAPSDVAFLRTTHRHLFKVKVSIGVNHNNRDIEFFQFKRFIDECISRLNKDDLGSCEMIADDLFDMILPTMETEMRKVVIEVSEDGENGCTCEYEE